MNHRPNRRSLFSQQLDRIAFAAYFLGAIVPLATLAWVVQHHELQGDGALKWVVLLVSIASLSLGAFLALRRTTRESIDRMARDQERLKGLLAASDDLSQLPDTHSCTDALLRHAGGLAKAAGAFFAERADDGFPFDAMRSLEEPAGAALAGALGELLGNLHDRGLGLAPTAAREALCTRGGTLVLGPRTEVTPLDAKHALEQQLQAYRKALPAARTEALLSGYARSAPHYFS